jgi:hypothetical protein
MRLWSRNHYNVNFLLPIVLSFLVDVNSNRSEGLAVKITEAMEFLKKATFGILEYLSKENTIERSSFYDYSNLPEWRKIFSSINYSEKEAFLRKVQDSWQKIYENVNQFKLCVKFLAGSEYFNRDGWPLMHPTFGRDSEEERIDYFKIQVKEFVEAYVHSFGDIVSDEAFEALFEPFKKHFPDFREAVHKEVAVLSGFESTSKETMDVEDFEIREIDPVELGIGGLTLTKGYGSLN